MNQGEAERISQLVTQAERAERLIVQSERAVRVAYTTLLAFVAVTVWHFATAASNADELRAIRKVQAEHEARWANLNGRLDLQEGLNMSQANYNDEVAKYLPGIKSVQDALKETKNAIRSKPVDRTGH